MALEEASSVRLNPRDWRLILVAIAVAAISLAVAARYFHRAFPEASIDFQVSGPGSTQVARQFLTARDLDVRGFLQAEQFDYDDNAKTFLERELGLQRSEQLLGSRIQLWRWENRWFKPLDAEEVDVAVSTAGSVVAFDHHLADESPGASLTEDQARTRAEQFLTAVLHRDWSAWMPIGAEREVKPHRTDYTFTWKETQPLVPGATGQVAAAEVRHEIRVQGDQIGSYDEYLKVPDQWLRDYEHLRSKNESAGLVDTGLMLVLFVAMLFVLVMRIRRGDVRWRPALWIGAAGAVLSFLASLNSLGAARFAYITTQPWSDFVANQLIGAIAAAVGVGVFFVVLTAAAESLYRERFPQHVAMSGFLSWRGARTKSFFLSMVLGLALAAFFFAYQTVFYLVANHFGAWAPADIPYDQLLNTKLPWAFVLFSGFFPAISEEFGFRMLAIPLFEKWFRWLWVAVIAASYLWGFGHATYPNQPWFIRGLEVGSGGVLLSWIMIRYGILATVVWHYTVDALYTAMLLLRAHDAYLRWSGATTAFLAIAPLLAAIVAYRWRRGFVPEEPLTNAAAGSASGAAAPHPSPHPPPAPAGPALAYFPIPGPNWTTGLIIAGALLSAFAVPVARWDTVLPWRTSRTQAVAAARRFLDGQGFDLTGYRAGVSQSQAVDARHGDTNLIAAADIFHHGGARDLLRTFSGPAPTVVADSWNVRFFRPLQKEEFDLAVRPDTGTVIAFSHSLEETAPGASPDLSTAQATAARFLAARGVDVGPMTVRTANQTKRPARTDSYFIWEATTPPPPQPLPGEVAYRVEADLAGSRVAYFTSWYYVPEARARAYSQGSLGNTLLSVLEGLLYAAAAGLVLFLLFRFARHPELGWGTPLKLAAAAGVLMAVIAANSLPAALASYVTQMPWSFYLLTTLLGVVLSGVGGFLLTLALLAPLAITAPHAAALTVANARRQLEQQTAWDALWVGLVSLAWVSGWDHVQAVINSRWHTAGSAPLPTPPAALTQWLPGLSDVLGAPLHTLWIAAGLGILLPVLWNTWRNPRHRLWAVGGIALLWIGRFPTIHHPAQFALASIFSGVELALLFGFGWLFLRNSPLAYLSAVLVPTLALPGVAWLNLDVPHAHAIGAVLLLLAAVWLAWLGLMSRPAPAR